MHKLMWYNHQQKLSPCQEWNGTFATILNLIIGQKENFLQKIEKSEWKLKLIPFTESRHHLQASKKSSSSEE